MTQTGIKSCVKLINEVNLGSESYELLLIQSKHSPSGLVAAFFVLDGIFFEEHEILKYSFDQLYVLTKFSCVLSKANRHGCSVTLKVRSTV